MKLTNDVKKDQVIWPEFYTAEDIALIEKANTWIEANDYTQVALARLARVAASTFNQILKGSYPTSPSKILKAIDSAMNHADESIADAVPAVETSVYRLAFTACTMARRYRNFGVLSAFVGTGKTFSLKQYAKQHGNTHFFEANPVLTSKVLLRQIARQVAGYDGAGGIADNFDAIITGIKNTDTLLIIDEAETLTEKQLEIIRRIRDIANIGIVLAGTEKLTAIIKRERGQFDQIRSRVGFWPETIRAVTPDDASAMVQASFGSEDVAEDVIKRLYDYSQGSARVLVEGLLAGIHQFRQGRPLDVKLVDAVAKQALCLKPIGGK